MVLYLFRQLIYKAVKYIMSIKIVIIGTTGGGIVSFRKDLIKALIADGHQVHTFAMSYTDHQYNQVLEMGAIPETYTLNRTGINPLSDLFATVKLAKKIKKIQPDLVFSYFSKPVIFGTLAAKLAGVPRRIAMLEGLGFTFTEQPNGLLFKTKIIRAVQVLLYRLAFPFLDRIIFLNPDDPVDLVEKYKLKVKQVSVLGGIGLNLADYPYSVPQSQPVRFIFIGRLLAEKGINEYIAAAQIVKQQYPEAECVVLSGFALGSISWKYKFKLIVSSFLLIIFSITLVQFSYAALRFLDLLLLLVPTMVLYQYNKANRLFDRSIKLSFLLAAFVFSIGTYIGFLGGYGVGSSPFLPYRTIFN